MPAISTTRAHLENLVLSDLLAWRDSHLRAAEVTYWRTASGEEVDFVIEAGDDVIPIEVKATKRDVVEWIASGVSSVPWWRIL